MYSAAVVLLMHCRIWAHPFLSLQLWVQCSLLFLYEQLPTSTATKYTPSGHNIYQRNVFLPQRFAPRFAAGFISIGAGNVEPWENSFLQLCHTNADSYYSLFFYVKYLNKYLTNVLKGLYRSLCHPQASFLMCTCFVCILSTAMSILMLMLDLNTCVVAWHETNSVVLHSSVK